MRVCVFGLGENGSSLAADFAAAGADVVSYDPAPVATPAGVNRLPYPALAAARSSLIVGATNEQDAELALFQAIEVFADDVVYADLSVSAPSLKKELASLAAAAEVSYADVAVMAESDVRGLVAPNIVCGDGAVRYAEIIGEYGGQAEVVTGESGTASRRKLLRSLVLSGTAAVVAEAMRAASETSELAWLWDNINDELSNADENWLHELLDTHKSNNLKQLGEIEATKALVEDLGVTSTMSEATVDALRDLPSQGLPDISDLR